MLCWSSLILPVAKRAGKRHNITSTIKKRVSSFSDVSATPQTLELGKAGCNYQPDRFNLAKAISSKLEDGNVKAAVRLLFSDDAPAQPSLESLAQLQAKHPAAAVDRKPFPHPDSYSSLIVDESEVLNAIRSFPAGSAGGPDGLRPQHLVDLVKSSDASQELLSALTAFVNMVLAGHCHQDIIPVLFGGRLIALNKKAGGIRPIAIGFTLRRLIAKCASRFAAKKLDGYFAPRQLGFGSSGGCEAAVHAARRFINSMPSDFVVAKLDFSNAFNCLHRDVMLTAVKDQLPELYNFCHLAYSQTSFLNFGPYTILSQEGPQQGDPLGPLLFCLAIQPLLTSLKSPFSSGYLDDLTVGGPEVLVASDVDQVVARGAEIGLHLNVTKCELIHHPQYSPQTSLLRTFIPVGIDEASLLGAPLLEGQELDRTLAKCCSELSNAIDKLETLSSHDALILLRSSFSAPKIQHILRCSPCGNHAALATFDALLRTGISRILNLNLSDIQWLQASLPVRDGGLGVRRVASLAIPAYMASAASTRQLQDIILSASSAGEDP